jgi:hypothetical protein
MPTKDSTESVSFQWSPTRNENMKQFLFYIDKDYRTSTNTLRLAKRANTKRNRDAIKKSRERPKTGLPRVSLNATTNA